MAHICHRVRPGDVEHGKIAFYVGHSACRVAAVDFVFVGWKELGEMVLEQEQEGWD